jgi:hypothetical protein
MDTEITYSKSFLWKLGMGIGAFFATVGTLFLGLISKDIRNLWLKAISGKEIYWIKKETIDSRTENIVRVGTQVLETSPEISREKQQILDDYGEGMVEALGGIDKVMNLPELDPTKWNGTLDPKQFTAPVTRGKFAGEPVIIFCYAPYDSYYVRGDFLRRRFPKTKEENQRWIAGGPGIKGELDFNMSSDGVPPGSGIEKQMFDRIRRLMSGQPVGRIHPYNESFFKGKKDNTPLLKMLILKGPLSKPS